MKGVKNMKDMKRKGLLLLALLLMFSTGVCGSGCVKSGDSPIYADSSTANGKVIGQAEIMTERYQQALQDRETAWESIKEDALKEDGAELQDDGSILFPDGGILEPLSVSMPIDASAAVPPGEAFISSVVAEGKLYYTVNSGAIYQDISACGLEQADFVPPFNTFMSFMTDDMYRNTMSEKYLEVSDYILSDGSIDPTHKLVLLDITVRNDNALGSVKKNVFPVNELTLTRTANDTVYYPAYFSEAAKSPESDQPFYYELPQGNEITVQLGYFVLSEDLDEQDVFGVCGSATFSIGA